MPHFQNEDWRTTFHMKFNEFHWHVTENSFSYEGLCTKARFEKEVRDISEIANFSFSFASTDIINAQHTTQRGDGKPVEVAVLFGKYLV